MINSIKYHLNDAIVLNRENELSLRCGCNIDASLTSLDIALSPNTSNKREAYLTFERLTWPLNGLNGI